MATKLTYQRLNASQPVFYFTGSFACSMPVLVREVADLGSKFCPVWELFSCTILLLLHHPYWLLFICSAINIDFWDKPWQESTFVMTRFAILVYFFKQKVPKHGEIDAPSKNRCHIWTCSTQKNF